VPGNCLASAYTGASGNQCAVISTGPSYIGQLYVQGTVYTPVAPIDITLNLITQQALRFGVISRVLWLKETGSISFSGPVIETPDDSPGSSPGSTVVFLEVFVCRNTSTCSIPSGAQPDLRARVSINDPTGSPAAGSRQMTILSWATRR
jgi:hypothetical protein